MSLKQARKGDYFRTWKCPRCGRTVECPYGDLAEAGTPICTDCGIEMEML